eukprot:9134618-Pyramimonas_sp.AAC.1
MIGRGAGNELLEPSAEQVKEGARCGAKAGTHAAAVEGDCANQRAVERGLLPRALLARRAGPGQRHAPRPRGFRKMM